MMTPAHQQPRHGPRRIADEPLEVSAVTAAILQLAERISQVIEEERQLLANSDHGDFDAIVSRKSHLVLEMGRLVQHVDVAKADEPLKARLTALSRELAGNAALLRRHLEAVREVSAIIANAINSASNDGTYSADVARRGISPC